MPVKPAHNSKNRGDKEPVAPGAKSPNPSSSEVMNQRLLDIAARCTEIQNVADTERRAMNDEELEELNGLNAEFDNIERELKTRATAATMNDRIAAFAQPQPRLTNDAGGGEDEPEQPRRRPAGSITGGMLAGAKKGTHGFRNMGEFALAAKAAKLQPGSTDDRLKNAPTTYGSESVNEDGGFAVPPDFRTAIMQRVEGEDSIFSMVDVQPVSGNKLSLPQDSEAPWDTSQGIQFNWVGEGKVIPQSKPKLDDLEMKLHKLAALVPLTDELVEDAPALSSWLMRKAPEKLTSVLNNVIIDGDGIAKPMGMLRSGSKIAVSSNSGTGKVTAADISAMWGRLYAKLRGRAVWLINQDVEAQLQMLVMPGTNPSVPLYVPPGGFSERPYATLLGRPVYSFEAMKEVGTEGDIMLVDPSQYLAGIKGGQSGLRTDVSMHLYFDTDHLAFRFIMRVGGQSYWKTPIARQNGGNTLSNIITIESDRTP